MPLMLLNPVVDRESVRELTLYAENSAELYGQRQSITKNLMLKMAKGIYDPHLAIKLWRYWFDEAARRYTKEYGGPGDYIFSPAERQTAAEEFSRDEFEKMKNGEYGELPTFKTRGSRTLEDFRRGNPVLDPNATLWTLSRVVQANKEMGHHFFDRKTLRFFGETLRNYRVKYDGDRVLVLRRGGRAGDKTFIFLPQTGDVRPLAGNPDSEWHRQQQEHYEDLAAGDIRAGHGEAAEFWRGAAAAEGSAVAQEKARSFRANPVRIISRGLSLAEIERVKRELSKRENPTPRQGYEVFHQQAPDRYKKVKVPANWPRKLWMLGRLNALILTDGTRISGGTVAAATGNRVYILNANHPGRLSRNARARQIEYITPSASRRAGPVWFHPFDNPPPVRVAARGFLTLAGKGIKLTDRGIVG